MTQPMQITSFKKKSPLIYVSLLALILTITIPVKGFAKEGWGAIPLSDRYRPKRDWAKRFASTPNVVANGSIGDAIESCDSIVGEGQYCVVEVTNTSSGLPLEIYRSKTKLIGVADMQPLISLKDDIFIYIGENTNKVIIEGLNIQGHEAGNKGIFGIYVEGENIRDIMIINNKIHDFNSNVDAHGIAVYGSGENARKAIRNVVIEGNEVSNMRTGSSESIVVNGNVVRWEIKNNIITNVNNIAIDAIGGEGTSPTRKRRGRVLPGVSDAARFGFIEGNTVSNMSTAGNPAYDNEESWAAAIYIDGARYIKIANNHVENASWAYMLGAENCVATRHITMIDNHATGSTYGDLYVGGYAEKGYIRDKSINCNPKTSYDEKEGHGYIKSITVKNNHFQSSSASEKLVTIGYRVTHAIIIESTVQAINTDKNGYARGGDSNAIKTTE